jgi:hypothetical protein
MRMATLTLAALGILFVGTTFAANRERVVTVPAAPQVTVAANVDVAVPVRRYVYSYRPQWYGYYTYSPDVVVRPRDYLYVPPRYDGDDTVVPYRGYYAPNGFNFEFNGPRRSFGFSF